MQHTRAMAAACRCPPSRGNSYIFLQYTHFLPRTSLRSHSGGVPKISFSSYLPDTRKKRKKQRKGKQNPVTPITKRAKPLLLHTLPPRLGNLLGLQLAFLLDGRGRDSRSSNPLPPWWGWWPPPPCRALGNLLGRTGISPCAVRTPTIRALCLSHAGTCGLFPPGSPQPSICGPS